MRQRTLSVPIFWFGDEYPLTQQGPIGVADKAILIDLLPIMLAMLVMANLNHNTMLMDQLMQVLR